MQCLKLVDRLLRDRESVYEQVKTGEGTYGLAGQLFLVYACLTAIYGFGMGCHRWVNPGFYFSDFEVTESAGAVQGKVVGVNHDAREVFVDHIVSPQSAAEATVRFNLSRPTDPYEVESTGERSGYKFIKLAESAKLGVQKPWAIALLSALKVPALFIVTLVICAPALYVINLIFGWHLSFMPVVTLMIAALAGTAVMLGVFVPIAFFFTLVTQSYHFIKVMHVMFFAIAGAYGVWLLGGGLAKLAPEGAGRGHRLLVCWLLLYCFVGTQMAWTLKPYFGTPYIPAIPPFRLEGGNFYVSLFGSLGQMGRR